MYFRTFAMGWYARWRFFGGRGGPVVSVELSYQSGIQVSIIYMFKKFFFGELEIVFCFTIKMLCMSFSKRNIVFI